MGQRQDADQALLISQAPHAGKSRRRSLPQPETAPLTFRTFLTLLSNEFILFFEISTQVLWPLIASLPRCLSHL